MTAPFKVSQSQAIFFDFDGVLADSVHVKSEAFGALYEDHGQAVMDQVVDYHLSHGGLSRYKKIDHFEREILGKPASAAEVDALAGKFGRLVKERVIAAAAIAGANEALALLAKRCPLYVISGTPEDELRDIVEQRGMAHLFKSVRGSPASKTSILGELLKADRHDPAACVMVGDAMEDYGAAKAHGVHFIGIVPSNEESRFPDGTLIKPDLLGFAGITLPG